MWNTNRNKEVSYLDKVILNLPNLKLILYEVEWSQYIAEGERKKRLFILHFYYWCRSQIRIWASGRTTYSCPSCTCGGRERYCVKDGWQMRRYIQLSTGTWVRPRISSTKCHPLHPTKVSISDSFNGLVIRSLFSQPQPKGSFTPWELFPVTRNFCRILTAETWSNCSSSEAVFWNLF